MADKRGIWRRKVGHLGDFINGVWRANQTNRERWIREQLGKVPSGARLLDAGCGGQPFRRYCVHLNYVAQDFGKLDAEKQIIGRAYGPIDYLCEITAIPVADASFDVILCTEVLEHVPEPHRVLQEFARILKSGGMLILTAPLGSFVHQAPFHFYGGYSSYWYERFLSRVGFEIVEIQQNGGFFRFFGQECQRLTRILFRERTIGIRAILFAIEICCWLFFTVTIPLACYWLDKWFPTPGTTIGYHVLARRIQW